eukprot:997881-Prorocentrum_minimum.AAC.1
MGCFRPGWVSGCKRTGRRSVHRLTSVSPRQRARAACARSPRAIGPLTRHIPPPLAPLAGRGAQRAQRTERVYRTQVLSVCFHRAIDLFVKGIHMGFRFLPVADRPYRIDK